MSGYDLTGRKALVTGAARGLGAGMAEALAKAGAAVVIADINEELGRETADALKQTGASAAFVPLDVTDDASWEAAITATIGEPRRAGHPGEQRRRRTVRPGGRPGSGRCPHDAGRQCPRYRAGGETRVPGDAAGGPAGTGGSVVNISSVAATIPFPGIAGYSATKSAVDRLTRVAAMESGKLGYGVRVNCVYPGLVPTEMGMKLAADMVTLGLWPSAEAAVGDVIGLTPLGRLGEVGDMADAVVFLASDAAKFITGAGLPVDGGMGM